MFDDERHTYDHGQQLLTDEDDENGYYVSDELLEQKLKGKPYSEAVQTLKAMKAVPSPFEKLLIMLRVRQSIEDNVQNFWEGIQVEQDLIQLTADQFIPIYMFVILKAQEEDLIA